MSSLTQIKSTTKTTLRSSHFSGKYLNLIFVLLLGLFGYWLGPQDLSKGDYTAEIESSVENQSLSLIFPFSLGDQSGEPLTITKESDNFLLIIEGEDVYKVGLGQQIIYRVQVLDTNGEAVDLTFGNATSNITGENYRQVLPPTFREDAWLLVAVIAIASSIDFALVVGTPPTMLAYSTGFFQVKDIFKRGVVLDLIGILILSFGVVWIWQWLGVVTF